MCVDDKTSTSSCRYLIKFVCREQLGPNHLVGIVCCFFIASTVVRPPRFQNTTFRMHWNLIFYYANKIVSTSTIFHVHTKMHTSSNISIFEALLCVAFSFIRYVILPALLSLLFVLHFSKQEFLADTFFCCALEMLLQALLVRLFAFYFDFFFHRRRRCCCCFILFIFIFNVFLCVPSAAMFNVHNIHNYCMLSLPIFFSLVKRTNARPFTWNVFFSSFFAHFVLHFYIALPLSSLNALNARIYLRIYFCWYDSEAILSSLFSVKPAKVFCQHDNICMHARFKRNIKTHIKNKAALVRLAIRKEKYFYITNMGKIINWNELERQEKKHTHIVCSERLSAWQQKSQQCTFFDPRSCVHWEWDHTAEKSRVNWEWKIIDNKSGKKSISYFDESS